MVFKEWGCLKVWRYLKAVIYSNGWKVSQGRVGHTGRKVLAGEVPEGVKWFLEADLVTKLVVNQ